MYKVDQDSEMDDELNGDRDYKTPMEDTCRWLLLVKLLQRFVEAEHHEYDRDTKSKICRLVISHFDAIKIEGRHRVGRQKTI